MKTIKQAKVSLLAVTTVITTLVAQLSLGADTQSDPGYVAHEWGTFTSVQGADGAPQPWHPLVTSDLPSFVYDCSAGAGPSKAAFVALQRMETPVIYFYSDRERTVSANVRFPQGQITEWYPVAAAPAAAPANPAIPRNGQLRWDNVRVLAGATSSLRLPHEPAGSHYYAARATDANLVQVQTTPDSRMETEKFLFYRGVGWFSTPLRVTMAENDETTLTLSNQGQSKLRHLFVIEMKQGKARFEYLPGLEAGHSQRVALETAMSDSQQVAAKLAAALEKPLTADGLYAREAAAMIDTWKDSWFGEDGLRVLYLLPRTWTDEVLPLELTPKPAELVRTMVGRAEVIRPSVERLLAEQIERFGAETGNRYQIVAQTRALGLGRFLEPAVRRVQARSQSEEFRAWADELLTTAGKPEEPGHIAEPATLRPADLQAAAIHN